MVSSCYSCLSAFAAFPEGERSLDGMVMERSRPADGQVDFADGHAGVSFRLRPATERMNKLQWVT